ncbi:lipid hydroperoxide peroxidase [Candidatus Velamenicoccus archaeovorus]|uniref:4a-hydroxytetrahydrobiopterin dehydratase n=1 Tax=Velamenicoccus archaeovorus TaxID=1930593 RepID=A0A410P439_VELA1|nr:thiol peroxidase [Candidatus Velamenicoccus archaeovorus]QAT16872.1 lipid hydroperoxide peroxidase [Candidatus Velamenicoccus archaeovorus]
MKKTITFKGKPLLLQGRIPGEGSPAPDFKLTNQNLEDVDISRYGNKTKILTTFLSLDTPVCEMQVKEFNKKASQLSEDVVIIAISNDLPFAQKRFCQAHEISQIEVLSDYRYGSFGFHYGLLIKELNLLARAVMIIDKDNILRYSQIVAEATQPPDYVAALQRLDDILKHPVPAAATQRTPHCVPCQAGTPPLKEDEVRQRLAKQQGWASPDAKRIEKIFKRKTFMGIKDLVDQIAMACEEEGHHPTLTWTYHTLKVALTTHASGGLTDNDFIVAGIVDELAA